MLAGECLYPTREIRADDPGHDVSEARQRQALHEIVEELDRTDLRAVYEVARYLVILPRDPAIFEYIKELDRRVLVAYGFEIEEMVGSPSPAYRRR